MLGMWLFSGFTYPWYGLPFALTYAVGAMLIMVLAWWHGIFCSWRVKVCARLFPKKLIGVAL
jgi:hypothetical protein